MQYQSFIEETSQSPLVLLPLFYFSLDKLNLQSIYVKEKSLNCRILIDELSSQHTFHRAGYLLILNQEEVRTSRLIFCQSSIQQEVVLEPRYMLLFLIPNQS